jgi:hypothetical protein
MILIHINLFNIHFENFCDKNVQQRICTLSYNNKICSNCAKNKNGWTNESNVPAPFAVVFLERKNVIFVILGRNYNQIACIITNDEAHEADNQSEQETRRLKCPRKLCDGTSSHGAPKRKDDDKIAGSGRILFNYLFHLTINHYPRHSYRGLQWLP